MSLTEAREVVTPDRTINPPRWRQIASAICAQNNTTLDTATSKGRGSDRLTLVRVQIARALHSKGYTNSQIARIVRRDRAVVYWYLGKMPGGHRREIPEIIHPQDMAAITHDEIKSVIHYAPGTGAWTWLPKIGRRRGSGRPAGSTRDGRRRIVIYGEDYYSNNLAWFYMTGKWSPHMIVYRNGNVLDDRWENLREDRTRWRGK